MSKIFPIPQLNQENWNAVQASLNTISHVISDLQNEDLNGRIKQELELVSIHLGMIDMYLGRHYTLDELKKELDEKKKELAREKELNEKY